MKTQPNTHVLPPLPYAATALEPHVDARTMSVHHDKHHASYVKALNEALESAPDMLRTQSAEWLLLHPRKLPEKIRTAVLNNAGGHVNHSLLWKAMSPDGGGTPTGALAAAINDSFGSFEAFKAEFEEAGAKLFGSGWVWLVKAASEDGTQRADAKLRVLTTTGHDNPITQGHVPLLLNDVWEHAYYLKHENRRPDYLAGWWSVTHWNEAARRLEESEHADEATTETT